MIKVKNKNKKERKSNALTLIELLAVIVILEILMLIAIPSVTRYINQSRKKTIITSINELVETVRYGVISEDSEYAMGNNTERTFALKDIPTEKGDTKDIEGYVKVIKTENGYEYKVKVNGSTIDSKNYCCDEVDIKNLENSLEKCSSSGSSVPRAYAVGDVINFAGSDWRVIKNSTEEDDYVTVLKSVVLTNSELGSYAYNDTYNTMEFTWTDTCHNASHGYSSENKTNCGNTNNYAGSKVKEFLEGTYINTLGSSKLKEINGYKIRLATIDELCTDINCFSSRYESWILNNYGGNQNNVYGYWTMTPYSNNSSNVYKLDPHGYINHNVAYYNTGVRPVINLLKSAVE